MATSPEHMDELAQAPKSGKPPITANPAFPWIVALWFAALLGIGSLIVPVALLERASTASGLASLLPMAAPPLGFTAQSLVALVGTLVGGILGFVLAKKIAAPKAARGTGRKPLSASEDIGDFGIEGDDHDDLPEPAPTGRRRALAIEQDEGPSDFLNVAPLPAVREPKEKPVAKEIPFEAAPVEVAPADEAVADEPDYEPADAAQFDEPRQEFQPAEEPRQLFQPDPVAAEEEGVEGEPFELDASAELDAELTEAQPEHAQDLPQPGFDRQEFMAVANASGPVVDVHYAEPAEAAATAIEPLAFSPPSMAREDNDHGDEHHTDEHRGDEQGEQHFAAEQTFAPQHDGGPESEDMVSDKQIFEAPEAPADQAPEVPVDELAVEAVEEASEGEPAEQDNEQGEGLVQLVQRLGSTLDKHREWSAEKAAHEALLAQAKAEAAAAAEAEAEAAAEAKAIAEEEEAAVEAPVPDEFDPAAAEDAAQAMAAYFGSPAASPAAETEESEAEVAEEAVEAPAFDKPADAEEEPRQRYGAFTGTIAAVELDVEDDDDEDDDLAELAASFSLPRVEDSEPEPMPRPAFDQPPAAAEAETAEEETAQEPKADETDDTVELADFASLNPFKRNVEEFVRIEEPEPDAENAEPAVLFPNQEGRKAPAPAARAFDPPATESEAAPPRAERPKPSNDDNERALREALLNLQRMGK